MSGRRVFSLAVILALVALVAVLGPADPINREPEAAPQHYYLSLGDSLAFGFQPSLFHSGDFAPADYVGYVGDFAAKHPELTVVNYGCPAETSASMLGKGRLGGGCPYPGELHDSYDGADSQAAAAVAFLTAHPGQVGLITIDIGSNDLLALVDSCKNAVHQLACVSRSVPATLETLRANYTTLLKELTPLAPDAQLVLFTYYNPLAVKLPGSDALSARASKVVERVATRFDATTVDAFAAINGVAGSPAERKAICKRTWECSKYADVHPTDLGYRLLAQALQQAVG